MQSIIFIDAEIGIEDKRINDLGAVKQDGTFVHTTSLKDFYNFIKETQFLCGHNIVHHDVKYIDQHLIQPLQAEFIDTLYLSPLLFPQRPYHKLLKDDKLQVDQLNNPLNDAIKARELFQDEINAFFDLSDAKKAIFYSLLLNTQEFSGFFKFINYAIKEDNLEKLIIKEFKGKLCESAGLNLLIEHYPVELAYTLALIDTSDYYSVTPPWLCKNYPKIENVIKLLRNISCDSGCEYCQTNLNINHKLKDFFGYEQFRTYDGEPLQEKAAQAAVDAKSLLAVFPTGGGKSITFQLPALMAGEAIHGLTVIISPLQSLMKDQVDNLNAMGLVDAVTINGLLSPIERAEAIERISSGLATLMYISPEQLRSKTIETLLLSRNVVRFVIDEAHCFSAWGQDFRVDYLYIGDFIKELQIKKKANQPIPVSCFTATAKQKVISDICDYFQKKLGLNLELFTSSANRENLKYNVIYKETDEEKYNMVRSLIEQRNCPTIIYVSRTKRTRELAEKLTFDGFPAKPFNGKMDASEKIANQEDFINNEVKIIVATSAFGMGVDKKDVKLVVHYDISDSLENYVQEAGRAGRDQSIEAECYVLFNERDLDKHFMLLNQTKLSMGEIQQVWKAVKDLTKTRPTIACSPLEIARKAGWDDSVSDIETRVKTAISSLENAGYVKRGRNMPRVYATSITAKDMQEASYKLENSNLFSPEQIKVAKLVIQSLISNRSTAKAGNNEAESRVDYLADKLGFDKKEIIEAISLMRQIGLLADSNDMSAYVLSSDTNNRSAQILSKFTKLERFVLSNITEDGIKLTYKEINDQALNKGISTSTVKDIKTIIYYLRIKGYIFKGSKSNDLQAQDDSLEKNNAHSVLTPTMSIENILEKFNKRIEICDFLTNYFYHKARGMKTYKDETLIQFSPVALFKEYNSMPRFSMYTTEICLADIEDALLYLSKIGAMKLEGGFLVSYNGMQIERLVLDNKIRYKIDDYKVMDDYYKQKTQQIHIVGEYANLMVKNYNLALQFVQDYFQIDFKKFLSKYFKGERATQIDRNITPEKYNQLFGDLSQIQSDIINNATDKYIVVAAGPGSGKTKVLVHKLAALLLLEDIKHEQLLMLTFSRAAVTEFKKRLMQLIGNAANFVEIKTFHSYCFDLLGKIGSLEGSDNVVKDAAEMIASGEVEQGRITKRVLVIDESQDMDENEFALVRALMANNEEMRIIAVGDDDQNIYEFRGSNSKYMKNFISSGAMQYEMIENYRSKANIVQLANGFSGLIKERIKQNPLKAVQTEVGTVQITKHYGKHFEQAVVNKVIETYKGGRACVITTTNEEALHVAGLLVQKGVRAKLIQSMDGFDLYNLAEIRYFVRTIEKHLQSPVISLKIWEDAKKKLKTKYNTSSCLENCLNLISEFEKVNQYSKYKTDLIEFIKESQYEDFYTDDLQTVFVSTIHKAKGREFDSVYMIINDKIEDKDETTRQLYVGLTRAKENLYIHSSSALFSKFNLPHIQHFTDNSIYPPPSKICLQLTHRDVVLDYFKGKKEKTLKLCSGDKLWINGTFLTAELDNRTVTIAKFSKAFEEKLQELSKSGFKISDANIRFIVAWKGKDESEETAIILPEINMQL